MLAQDIAQKALLASTVLKTLTNEQRSQALENIYQGIKSLKQEILAANKLDCDAAQKNQLDGPLQKRLDLSRDGKFTDMLEGIRQVAALEDPIGKITLARQLDQGLDLYRVTCPVGVLLVIFELRPEVIANIASLAVKSGNAAILKGGRESLQTFQVLTQVITRALNGTEVPEGAVQLVNTREEVGSLLAQDRYIDLVIPRGSNALVRSIKENTKIPVLGHADGLCSAFVAEDANVAMAKRLLVDSKTDYPAACNAVETLLFEKSFAAKETVLAALAQAGVTLHLDPGLTTSSEFQAQYAGQIKQAVEEDFGTEFLSLDIAVKQVDSVEAAISHINQHSSKHTDLIITENEPLANKFLNAIDSAGVYWNCSTRFADGFRYGFGTEVGISTNKIHARGPMGLEGLVCYQYHMKGHGQIVSDFGEGKKAYIHKDIK